MAVVTLLNQKGGVGRALRRSTWGDPGQNGLPGLACGQRPPGVLDARGDRW